jgi:hypothetical protein
LSDPVRVVVVILVFASSVIAVDEVSCKAMILCLYRWEMQKDRTQRRRLYAAAAAAATPKRWCKECVMRIFQAMTDSAFIVGIVVIKE